MALPIIAIALGVGALALIFKASKSSHGDGTGTKCTMNGEEFTGALAKVDATYPANVPANARIGALILQAYGNPMARRADLMSLADSVRKLRPSFPEADRVADCIEDKAQQATN